MTILFLSYLFFAFIFGTVFTFIFLYLGVYFFLSKKVEQHRLSFPTTEITSVTPLYEAKDSNAPSFSKEGISQLGVSLKKGNMKVKGSFKVWQNRYFDLRHGKLVYYGNHKSKKVWGIVKLDGCKIDVQDKKHGPGVRIWHPNDKCIYSSKGLQGETLISAKFPGSSSQLEVCLASIKERDEWFTQLTTASLPELPQSLKEDTIEDSSELVKPETVLEIPKDTQSEDINLGVSPRKSNSHTSLDEEFFNLPSSNLSVSGHIGTKGGKLEKGERSESSHRMRPYGKNKQPSLPPLSVATNTSSLSQIQAPATTSARVPTAPLIINNSTFTPPPSPPTPTLFSGGTSSTLSTAASLVGSNITASHTFTSSNNVASTRYASPAVSPQKLRKNGSRRSSITIEKALVGTTTTSTSASTTPTSSTLQFTHSGPLPVYSVSVSQSQSFVGSPVVPSKTKNKNKSKIVHVSSDESNEKILSSSPSANSSTCPSLCQIVDTIKTNVSHSSSSTNANNNSSASLKYPTVITDEIKDYFDGYVEIKDATGKFAKKWIVLRKGLFAIFKNEASGDCSDLIDLSGCEVRFPEPDISKKKFSSKSHSKKSNVSEASRSDTLRVDSTKLDPLTRSYDHPKFDGHKSDIIHRVSSESRFESTKSDAIRLEKQEKLKKSKLEKNDLADKPEPIRSESNQYTPTENSQNPNHSDLPSENVHQSVSLSPSLDSSSKTEGKDTEPDRSSHLEIETTVSIAVSENSEVHDEETNDVLPQSVDRFSPSGLEPDGKKISFSEEIQKTHDEPRHSKKIIIKATSFSEVLIIDPVDQDQEDDSDSAECENGTCYVSDVSEEIDIDEDEAEDLQEEELGYEFSADGSAIESPQNGKGQAGKKQKKVKVKKERKKETKEEKEQRKREKEYKKNESKEEKELRKREKEQRKLEEKENKRREKEEREEQRRKREEEDEKETKKREEKETKRIQKELQKEQKEHRKEEEREKQKREREEKELRRREKEEEEKEQRKKEKEEKELRKKEKKKDNTRILDESPSSSQNGSVRGKPKDKDKKPPKDKNQKNDKKKKDKDLYLPVGSSNSKKGLAKLRNSNDPPRDDEDEDFYIITSLDRDDPTNYSIYSEDNFDTGTPNSSSYADKWEEDECRSVFIIASLNHHRTKSSLFFQLPRKKKEKSEFDEDSDCIYIRIPDVTDFEWWARSFSECIPKDGEVSPIRLPSYISSMIDSQPFEECAWLNVFMARYFCDMKNSQPFVEKLKQIMSKQIAKINPKRPNFLGEFSVENVTPGTDMIHFDKIKMMESTRTPGELVGEMDLTYKGSASVTISSEVYINWPTSKFAKVPVMLSVTLDHLSGKLQIFGAERSFSRFSASFVSIKDLEFNANIVLGEKLQISKYFPQIKQFIINQLKKMIWKHTCTPNKITFSLPLPGIKLALKTTKYTSRRSRSRREHERTLLAAAGIPLNNTGSAQS
eukprot:TRINITY_DN9804_c0_g1_i1.p1 TRINITY_DN9804_c0_g1~~TRINITY_DN9804_c0_g1_i1.p1  ORF type:complete len:1463 (+),score=399.46 TRINITY_DN9804_c0_g1_i1:121-4509(+)